MYKCDDSKVQYLVPPIEIIILISLIITSANEAMFSPGFVHLSVCEQDNSKTYRRILMKFSGYV